MVEGRIVEGQVSGVTATQSQPPAPAVTGFARLHIKAPQGNVVVKDLLRPTTLVGSLGLCNIQLIGPTIGPAHCAITLESGTLHVYDLRTSAGTWKNGSRVDAAPLADGDVLKIGSFECRIETNLAAAAEDKPQSGAFARLVIAGSDGRAVVKDVLRPATLVGSLNGCNIQLVGPGIVPLHCLITVTNGRLRIRDLRTRSGTWVNKRAVTAWTLTDGDAVDIGPFCAQVETNFDRLTADRDDRPDARFGIDGTKRDVPGAPDMTAERPAQPNIAAEQENLQSQRVELARLLEKLESARHQLTEDTHAMAGERERLSAEAAALAADRESGSRERDELRRHRETLESDRLAHAAAREAGEVHATRLVERETELENRIAALDARDAQLQAIESSLAQREDELQRRVTEVEAATAALWSADKQLDERTAEQARRQADLDARQNRVESAESDLAARQGDLEHQAKQIEVERTALESAKLQVASARDDLRSRAEECRRQLAELDSGRAKLQAREKSLVDERTQMLAAQQDLVKERESLNAVRGELSAQEQAGRAARLELENVRRALEDDQARLRSVQETFDAAKAKLEQDVAGLNREKETLSAARRALESSQSKLQQDRQAIALARHDLDEASARHSRNRAALEGEQRKLAEAQAAAEEREFQAAQAAADLAGRQFEVAAAEEQVEAQRREFSERSDQLRGEQTLLRAAQKQLEATLDEFRSEQRRFQMAILSIKSDRTRLRRAKDDSEQIHADRRSAAALQSARMLSGHQAEWFSNGDFGEYRIGNHRVVGLLSLGHSTWIYEADDPRGVQRVALKSLKTPLVADLEARRLLEREVRLGRTVQQSNLVRTLTDVIDENGSAAFAMELVEGITLSELIALHGALPWREVCNYVFQAAVGLAALHAAGIVHRGVEPSNMLVTRDGSLKVGDFGCAAFQRESARLEASEIGQSVFMDYAAPELFEADHADPLSDVYSLGCSFYHALCGVVPFPVSGAAPKLEAHRTEKAKPVRLQGIQGPPAVFRIVAKMMAKRPDDRLSSMDEVSGALGSWARRQYAYFDRNAALAQRAAAARDRLREEAHRLSGGQPPIQAVVIGNSG